MSVVTATIKSKDKELPASFELLQIEISREVNRIPSAELVLIDGNPAKRTFLLSDDAFFEPGKEIEIQLRYEGKGANRSVFKGLVVRHNLESGPDHSTLTVELKDTAFGMTRVRNSEVFTEKTDTDIFKNLIKIGGLKEGKLPKTETKHPEIIQYYCSDWDFMLSRAESNNLLVAVTDSELSLHKIEVKGTPKEHHTFTYGISEVFGFEIEADASHQYESIKGTAWNPKNHEKIHTRTALNLVLPQKKLNGKSIAGKFGGKKMVLTSMVPLEQREIENWADSHMARTRMSLLRGTLSVPGFAEIKLMDVIELKDFGERFQGKTVATGIQHTVDHEGWMTHIQFGLSADSFSRSEHIQDAPAAGLLPGVQGLQIGIVDAFEEDKDMKEFRVRLILPGIDPKKGKIWARLASPEAGKGTDAPGRGFFFRPEKGDEVVVGFFNNDPRQAVILGAMFGSQNKPPKGWDPGDKNALKGIVSKTGITMEINDTAKTLTFKTPKEQSILMDGETGLIKIEDDNKNTITLDDKGITIHSAKALTLDAPKGDFTLNAKKITLNGSGAVAIKGTSVDIK